MTNAILRERPDAGNPRVWFDGETALAKPRRGPLLCKTWFYSGEAVYAAVVELDRTPSPDAYLDLGAVRDVADVTVNGHRVGAVWYEPFRVFAGSWLRLGRNTLEIRVANGWANRLIGDAALPRDYELGERKTFADFGGVTRSPIGAGVKRLPDWVFGKAPRTSGRTTFCTWDYYPDGGPLHPAGLLGPVRLVFPGHATRTQ